MAIMPEALLVALERQSLEKIGDLVSDDIDGPAAAKIGGYIERFRDPEATDAQRAKGIENLCAALDFMYFGLCGVDTLTSKDPDVPQAVEIAKLTIAAMSTFESKKYAAPESKLENRVEGSIGKVIAVFVKFGQIEAARELADLMPTIVANRPADESTLEGADLPRRA